MKTALITGASGDMGRAMALVFAEAGWAVALHCFTGEESARRTAGEIVENGGAAGIYAADLRDETQVEGLFARIEEELGPVEVLVNNAGADWKGLLTDMSLTEWNDLLAIDLTAAFLTCRRALPHMVREKRGSIVNVASIWGEVGASCEAAYSAAKAGLIGLTRALAKEVGPSGVRVNCLSPGVIDTKMNGDLSPADLAALAEETPLGRIGTPEETAKAALFLAEHPFLTGQVLGVNGGFGL